MSELLYLKPWQIGATITVRNAVVGSDFIGKKTQSRFSSREIITAKVKRTLQGLQVPYFEYFLRSVADGGIFEDYYSDGTGTKKGEMRAIGGYTITPRGKYFVIECTIEIYR